jgi:hypothetical protein
MTYTRDDVVSAVHATFPKSDAPTILGILDLYGTESYEREKERVQLAIISLSEGNEDQLLDFVQAAKTDYRDVLSWQDSGPLSEAEGQKQRQNVRRLLDQWGKK